MVNELTQDLDPELLEFWQRLTKLQQELRNKTLEKYQRINPFCEDLFNWQERGRFWSKEEGVTLYNSTTVVGDVKIGQHTWIGPFCALDGTGGLEIGSYCSISQGCQLLTHDSVKWALSGGEAQYEYAQTKIEDNCFLGANVVVLKGVIVGNHSVVAAGAVVTKDVEEYSIMAGVPAKRIGNVKIKEDTIDLEYF